MAPVTEPVVPLRTVPIRSNDISLPHHRFGELFCSVLAHINTSGQYGLCREYFTPTFAGAPLPPSIPNLSNYRILVAPGIFGQCVEAIAPAFGDAIRHMRDEHGIDVEYVSLTALGSSEFNARQVSQYLQQHWGADQRRYIAFGYSKAASDFLEALTNDATTRTAVAALVTVSGSVLGSRLTEGVPPQILDFLKGLRLGSCEDGDLGGVASLRRAPRAAAMAKYSAPPGFRAYSIAAVSSAATTSRVLLNGWNQLTAYSLEQDSQVIHEDAIVPGGTYLGLARGDHWAVALPFEDIPPSDPLGEVIARAVDHNHYPRTALFEAALRYVLGELP